MISLLRQRLAVPSASPAAARRQRGAALTGYALTLSAFVALSLASIQGLEARSSDFLEETGDNIGASREVSVYEEIEEIPESTGDGSSSGGVDDSGTSAFEFESAGQFQSVGTGMCIQADSSGKIVQEDCIGTAEQVISVYTNTETGTSQLRIDGECIGLLNDSSGSGDKYIIEACDEDDATQLYKRNGLAWESATHRSPVMCMDITGASSAPGTEIIQWSCHGGTNQQWADPAPYVPPTVTPPIPVVTGAGTFVGDVPDGADLSPDGAYEDNDQVFVFSEGATSLTSDLTVDGVTIPAGTVVCSYIVWYDPVSNNEVFTTIDFGAPVLAGAQSTEDLSGTAGFANPNATYDYSRAWESDDGFNASGNTLDIDPYAVVGNADMLRVFVDCTP